MTLCQSLFRYFLLGTDTFSAGLVPDTNTSCHIIAQCCNKQFIWFTTIVTMTDSQNINIITSINHLLTSFDIQQIVGGLAHVKNTLYKAQTKPDPPTIC